MSFHTYGVEMWIERLVWYGIKERETLIFIGSCGKVKGSVLL
ncbi:purine-nucleoside phosphorylase [Paenibacillus sp. PvP094]